MNMLASLKSDVKVAADSDVLGGSRVLDTDIYAATLDAVFTGMSDSGAMNVTIHAKTDSGQEIKQTIYITSNKEKGQKTYYTKNDVNYPLPGFSVINNIAQLAVGKDISELETENKIVKVYDFKQSKEVMKEVPMIVDLVGKKVEFAIMKEVVDKEKSDGNGGYAATGETREQNEIVKVFCLREGFEHQTASEIRDKVGAAEFHPEWLKKNKGTVRNKAKSAGTAGAPGKLGAPGAGATTRPAGGGIFGD